MDIDSIRELHAQFVFLNYLTYSADDGIFAVDARMQRKFEDGHEWKN